MNELKQMLKDEYGCSDKRIRKLEKMTTFIVDDRKPSDVGADRNLYVTFCRVFLTVEAHDRVNVALSGNVPEGAAVTSWLRSNPGAQWTKHGVHAQLAIAVEPQTVEPLRTLARAIRSIVAPGAPRYDTPSYKYVCPRTAASLERLAKVLDDHW
jgi:hypothetical protein